MTIVAHEQDLYVVAIGSDLIWTPTIYIHTYLSVAKIWWEFEKTDNQFTPSMSNLTRVFTQSVMGTTELRNAENLFWGS